MLAMYLGIVGCASFEPISTLTEQPGGNSSRLGIGGGLPAYHPYTGPRPARSNGIAIPGCLGSPVSQPGFPAWRKGGADAVWRPFASRR
jgi:hypothetical protein